MRVYIVLRQSFMWTSSGPIKKGHSKYIPFFSYTRESTFCKVPVTNEPYILLAHDIGITVKPYIEHHRQLSIRT